MCVCVKVQRLQEAPSSWLHSEFNLTVLCIFLSHTKCLQVLLLLLLHVRFHHRHLQHLLPSNPLSLLWTCPNYSMSKDLTLNHPDQSQTTSETTYRLASVKRRGSKSAEDLQDAARLSSLLRCWFILRTLTRLSNSACRSSLMTGAALRRIPKRPGQIQQTDGRRRNWVMVASSSTRPQKHTVSASVLMKTARSLLQVKLVSLYLCSVTDKSESGWLKEAIWELISQPLVLSGEILTFRPGVGNY